MAGYSGTPLAKKLGLKDGFLVQIINQPKEYFNFFHDFPKVEISSNKQNDYDFIHIFSKDKYQLDEIVPLMKNKIKPTGIILISWPKKSSGVEANISGNDVRSIGLAHGLVDIKVCAVSEVWSGLKFVIPVKER